MVLTLQAFSWRSLRVHHLGRVVVLLSALPGAVCWPVEFVAVSPAVAGLSFSRYASRRAGPLLHWRPVLISGLRPFRRSCDLLTADESFGLTPDFIAAASRISLRIRQFLYQRSSRDSRLVAIPLVAPRIPGVQVLR